MQSLAIKFKIELSSFQFFYYVSVQLCAYSHCNKNEDERIDKYLVSHPNMLVSSVSPPEMSHTALLQEEDGQEGSDQQQVRHHLQPDHVRWHVRGAVSGSAGICCIIQCSVLFHSELYLRSTTLPDIQFGTHFLNKHKFLLKILLKNIV